MARNKLLQKAGVSTGKGGVDRLVGITNAHPIAFTRRQLTQHLFLQGAGILRFILQHKGPAALQPEEIIGVGVECTQGEDDQIIKVNRPANKEAALIVGVDVQPKVEQRPGAGLMTQACLQLMRFDT